MSKVEDIKKQIELLKKDLEWELNKPQEPEVGTVIGFQKQFQPNGSNCTYIALCAENVRKIKNWYLSSSDFNRILTWDGLLNFIADSKIWYVSGWADQSKDAYHD